MKNILTVFSPALLMVTLLSCKVQQSVDHIQSVTGIYEVSGAGRVLTAALITYDEPIKAESLSPEDFEVSGKKITKAYATNTPQPSPNPGDGQYVILELSPGAGAFAVQSGGHESEGAADQVSLRQNQEIETVSGKFEMPFEDFIQAYKQSDPVVDKFKQFEFKDAATGRTLKYNLFIPEHYDKNKLYPMVLFIHDASVAGKKLKTALTQGLGAVIWATPGEQAKHESFVLAPVYSDVVVNDQSEATVDLDVTVRLVRDLENRYSLDTNRFYTTGQSMGCMMSIAMDIKYPDLFAGSLLVAGQWDASKVSPLAKQNIWIIVSQDDAKAFPGMNAITDELEKKGAQICRSVWPGTDSNEQFAADVTEMLAGSCNIKYTSFKKGTVIPPGESAMGAAGHRNTWRIAYTIEGVRDWLFKQKKV